MALEDIIIKRLRGTFGQTVDLRNDARLIKEIIRSAHVAGDEPGTPDPKPEPQPQPKPEPAPGEPGVPDAGRLVRNEDIMKAVLKLTRDVGKMRTELASKGQRNK